MIPVNFDLKDEVTAEEASLDHVINLLGQLENICRRRINNTEIETVPLYRGEPAIYQTTLIPSVFRTPEKFNDIYFESKIVDQYSLKHSDRMPKLAQLGNMQHYSFPTRLLDWSSNINVALYFAVFNNIEMDGVVYIFLPSLCGNDSVKPMEFFNETALEPYVSLINIPHNTPKQIEYWQNKLNMGQFNKNSSLFFPWCFVVDNRIFSDVVNIRQSAQDGFFTYHVGYIDGNQYRIIPKEIQDDFGISFALQTVCRVIIPARFKPALAIKLLNKGISTKMLFPDIPVYNEVEYLLAGA